jgi:L-lactate dehydrogenase
VDLLTLYMIRHSGLAPSQVIGTGTLLDTSRFRQQISDKLRVDPRNVHAYIIGEHGKGSVPVWSRVQIGVLPLESYAAQSGISIHDKVKEEIFERVLGAGQDVIQRKGATFYGIAQSVVRILTAIGRDERSILTVSTDVSSFEGVDNVAMSLPVLINRRGAQKTLNPELSDGEMEAFCEAGAKLNELAKEVGIL